MSSHNTPKRGNQSSSSTPPVGARPGIARPVTSKSLQMRKPPVSPPVYRPQVNPKSIQPKNAENIQRKVPPQAPPVYRPQPLPKVLQTKRMNAGSVTVKPNLNGKQAANISKTHTAGNASAQVRRNTATPFAQLHQAAIQPSSLKRTGEAGSSIHRQPGAGSRNQNRQINPPLPPVTPRAQVLQNKLNQAQGSRIHPIRNAAKTVQLKPTYPKYKSWLDKQTIPTRLRGTLNARLVYAQNAIAYTRQKLVHGAGNITEQVKKSNVYSVLYAKEAYDRTQGLSNQLQDPLLNREELVRNHIVAQAITARKTRAGNCDHFAAIALFYLVEHAPQNSGKLYRIRVGPTGAGHSVVIYADDGWTPTVANDQDSYHTAVVVDAWPTNAFAIAWADWTYKDDNPSIILTLSPSSVDGTTRNRVVRGFRAPLKVSNEYQNLKVLKQKSTTDYNLNKTEYFRDEAPITSRYPAWTDEHPLYKDHPSDTFCFITSACVEAKGFSDNCDQLNTLRAFRDGYMLNHPDGEELIAEYYKIAPRILERIREQPDPQTILLILYKHIEDCLLLIRVGENEAALWHYVAMVENLRDTYLVNG